jgi:hypothetical protein
MRISFALALIVSACGLVAQADDPPAPLSIEPGQPQAPVGAAADGAVMQYNDANHLSWHLPFYYGRGEWRMPCACQTAPDGTSSGCCAMPRSYHLHLWDNYCYESTRCPACGFSLGGIAHYWMCERERNYGNCGCAACAAGRSHGCAARAESPAADAPATRGEEVAPARPVPPPPTLPDDQKEPAKDKDSKSAKRGYQLYEADASAKARPVATWSLLDRLRAQCKPKAR